MRPFFALTLWLAAIGTTYAENTIHFVALAGIKQGKEAQFDAFIKAVTPIWKRHGMTVVARARPVTPFLYRQGPVDLTVLKVESRTGFYAYMRDPDYRALQPQRLDAVDLLGVFDGTVENANEASLLDSPLLRVWFVSRPGAAWAKMLASDLDSQDGSSLRVDLGVIGEVVGTLGDRVSKARTIHIETLENKSPVQPPYLEGLHVVWCPRMP
ncbi:MAG: hypothetical protein ACR2PF_04955 [Rhizobiaceae bacterium]